MTIIDEVKRQVDIVDVVSDYVELERVGRRYRALCPFHAEKTPSFVVFPDSQRWHCFGACSEGDVFDFVQRIESITFSTALDDLAHRAGMEVEPLSAEEQAQIEDQRAYAACLAIAAGHFADHLAQCERAMSHARDQRGWSEDAIAAEGLGYADGSPLPDLRNKRAQRVVEALNRWAGRVGGALIYVHWKRGRVVYLSGRSLEGKRHHNPPQDLAGPRRPYANSVYSPRCPSLVILEGQACAITLGDWAISALALAGSGLSGALETRLQRHTEQGTMIYLVPDGDGKTAVDSLVSATGPALGIVNLPDGVDDANDLAQNGATAEDFQALMEAAPGEIIEERRSSADDNGRYTSRDGRLCVVRYDGQGERRAEPLCNFVGEVTEDVVLDDGSGSPDRTFRIRGRFHDGTPLSTLQVKVNTFSSMGWIQDAWGIRTVTRAGYRTRDRLREAIQLRSRTAEHCHVFTQTGWRETGGDRVFLHASGAVGGDDVEVALDQRRERCEAQLERLKRLFVLGDISEGEYRRERDDLRARLAALKPPEMPDLEQAARLLDDIGVIWEEATLEEEKQIAHTLLEAVYLDSEDGPVVRVEPRPAFKALFELAGEEG
jgi:hypothetical protein